ncbi:tyrosine-type recombinase/integrase [Paenibacillus sp. SC116]|uniref:tyrosine-type recombinase/integrase n=1 Tax=Paenibacillus sp. SC116 TaxID=2968986 RepID=UPI00215A9DFE|nr:tyrosine-type recombinase/integrase [Paenibacillus sp. SC116]MCR8843061.1 tyrosine-type recombinase/integrase [Paenibacillus sp. SC116]
MSTKFIRKDPKFTFVSKQKVAVKIDIGDAIEKFLYTKRIEKRSGKTIKTYKQALDQFTKWYEETEQSAITSEGMREYIHYLSFEKAKWDDHPTNPTGDKGLTPRTVNNVIRILKIFFNYLKSEKLILHSPMDVMSYQTEAKDTFDVFTDEDVVALLSAPNQRVYTGLRDYAMMLTLCDTGLRIKELTNLRISDINFNLFQIVIRAETTKTNTTRVVPVSKLTAKVLERLISYMNVEDNDYLWLTQFGERYFGDSVAKMMKLYANRIKIKGPRVSPHTFRHYFAVKFLRNGGDPIALMRILGHTSITMTEKYVRYTKTDISEQHLNASPVMSLMDKGNEKKRGKTRFK